MPRASPAARRSRLFQNELPSLISGIHCRVGSLLPQYNPHTPRYQQAEQNERTDRGHVAAVRLATSELWSSVARMALKI